MPRLPLAERVVEVIADRGETVSPRYRYGSGCVVAGRTVLTAAHVVTGAVRVLIRDPRKVVHEAALDPEFVGDVDGPGPDLALLEIADTAVSVPAIGLAAVDRDSLSADPVERCHVIGYPAFMETVASDGGQLRETADAFGRVPVLSGLVKGLLSVQVSSAPRPLPPGPTALRNSQWSGMSGAPVTAGGLLLGVVAEHAPREGAASITATPLTALEADPTHPAWGPGVPNPGAWWARIGVTDASALALLPAPRRMAEPAYRATVREIQHRTTMQIGRERELAEIADFAAGADGYRWLVGDAWAGKTSLLAQAATRVQGETDVVSYFLSRREADADSSRFLAAVVPQLAYLLEEDPPAADTHQFRAMWQRASQRAIAGDRHLLLVVDGLDEDMRPPGLPSVAALLPGEAGGHTHVLVSSRPYPRLPADLLPGHPLSLAQPVRVQPFAGAREVEALARHEIDDLLRRDDDGLTTDVLGLLTAAAGPLSVRDLVAMTVMDPQSATLPLRIRRLLTTSAARSLQPAGSAGSDRFQFAHHSLLEYAQANDFLNGPDFLHRIHQWADSWHDAGWPEAADAAKRTPRYLLDSYPPILAGDPQRLAVLVSDARWIQAAVQSSGVDRVLADLQRAAAAAPASEPVAAMLAAVSGQAHYLRPPRPVEQAGYVARQLCLQAMELAEDQVADDLRHHLQSRTDSCLIPTWTTRRSSRAATELGHLAESDIFAAETLPDGRVLTLGRDCRLLAWNPAAPGTGPTEVGSGYVAAVAVLPDGRVVTSEVYGEVLVWNLAARGTVSLGRISGMVEKLTVLPDGRVIGAYRRRMLMWDPAAPGVSPTDLGPFDGNAEAVAALPDGRVASVDNDGWVLLWDPSSLEGEPLRLGRSIQAREPLYPSDDRVDRLRTVAALPDGRLVTGGHSGQVNLWDPSSSSSSPAMIGQAGSEIGALTALSDGRVVTAGGDGRVLLWDPAAAGSSPAELGRHDGSAAAVAALSDGRVVTVGGGDGRVLLWDPPVAAAADSGPAASREVDYPVTAVAAFPDGRVATGQSNGRVLVWNPADHSARPTLLKSHGWPVRMLAVLPDGRVAVIEGHEEVANRGVLVFDPAVPGRGPEVLGGDEIVFLGAALPDGRLVTSGTRTLVWDPAVPRADPVVLDERVYDVAAMAALPDGRVVSVGSYGHMTVRAPAPPPRTRPRRPRPRLRNAAAPDTGSTEIGQAGGQVDALAVFPDGRVVTGGSDGRVMVWDPDAPADGPTVIGETGSVVRAVAVLPDGQVITSGADRRVLAWDMRSPGVSVTELGCSVTVLATVPAGSAKPFLVAAHEGSGVSTWAITA